MKDGYQLSYKTPLVYVGQVVWSPESHKAGRKVCIEGQILPRVKNQALNSENWHFYA